MKIFDNITSFVHEDLRETITPKSCVSLAAATFSIYAYQELKAQLEEVDEFRFIFSSPTFTQDREPKEKREFYIPKRERERSLYGTEFELKLRNEMTQKAVAKECADWIRRKARFQTNTSGALMDGFMTVQGGQGDFAYSPIKGFTTVDLGCDRGNKAYNIVTRLQAPHSQQYLKTFDSIWADPGMLQDVTDTVVDHIANVYQENSPELIYFLTLYHVFKEFLEDISEDVLPNEATGFKNSKIWSLLYDFQQDAALAIINKLEQYQGCILADSVGLGKTFTALAVVKYYENRNKNVLVLCPKKLAENWNTYKDNYLNNPIAEDRLRYDVLFHTDLSRKGGMSNGLDLDRLNWSNYDLVVIDESHNFRNGGDYIGEDRRENRYLTLMNKVIKVGVQTKVLMLSATPVNNRFNDLKNQLAIAYEGDPEKMDAKLDTTKSIDDIFRQAQKAYNQWTDLPAKDRTTDRLLQALDFDFFKVLDSVTIARSRKHIEKYYNTEAIGKFPRRLKPVSKRPPLTDLSDAITYNDIFDHLMMLKLEIYTPSAYIFASKLPKYQALLGDKGKNLTQSGRERGIQRLMSVNLLKRLESSVHSFYLTLQRIHTLISDTLAIIDQYEASAGLDRELPDAQAPFDWDADDQNTEFFTVGNKVKIDLADMDYLSWKEVLKEDVEILELLLLMVADITPAHDSKLQALLAGLSEKIEHPINPGNKKVLIFSAFSDTADYLYEQVSQYMLDRYGLHTGLVTGDVEGRSTIKGLKGTLNNILTHFSPRSKDRDLLVSEPKGDIDILIATDVISEGQNLQDCDTVVNYDIHWNPVRIIQRFGRIDRIGSKNEVIQLVNYWPDMTLDAYIQLKARVETRMKISVMTSTGDDDPLNPEEKGDLEYRKNQLEKLQTEVVDLEDISGGVNIMDLGLNEFRLDLLEYLKAHKDLGSKPLGLHAVVPAEADLAPGVLFVLKNRNAKLDIDRLNQIHPFYMVYMSREGEVVLDYLHPKKLLDTMRLACRGKDAPIQEVTRVFNQETQDGRNMGAMSALLTEAIASIIDRKEESDLDSLFSPGGTTALVSDVSGLDDFELVCFLVLL